MNFPVAGRVNEQIQVTQSANRWRQGDAAAGDALFRELDQDLRLIAAARLRRESGNSLSTGDLVNEAVIRLSQLKRIEWTGRPHVLALASTIMRQVLIDHVRRKTCAKRNREEITLCTGVGQTEQPVEVLALNMALEELAKIDRERADIVEMRYFGGMSIEDIATVLDLSPSTVRRRWAAARFWLYGRLRH
jgi:RNA polymerase sigma factor (TIGR02999 family)